MLWIAARGSTPSARGNLAADEMLMMAELRACPSPPAGSHQPHGPGPALRALVITGGLEPQNRARCMGQGWAEGPQLSQSPPHRPVELDFAGGIVQKAGGSSCWLPVRTSLLSPRGSGRCFCASEPSVSPPVLQERSCCVGHAGCSSKLSFPCLQAKCRCPGHGRCGAEPLRPGHS